MSRKHTLLQHEKEVLQTKLREKKDYYIAGELEATENTLLFLKEKTHTFCANNANVYGFCQKTFSGHLENPELTG